MKILYLVPHVPNPTKARSHFQIHGLLDAGHRVTVATLARSTGDQEHIAHLRQAGAAVMAAQLTRRKTALNALTALPSRQPMQARFLWSEELMRAIEAHLQHDPPNVIHVEHLRMAYYGLRLVHGWPVIWDAVDYLTPLFQDAAHTSANIAWRLIAWLEAARLRTYEQWLTGQFPVTLVISGRDQALFQLNNPYASRVKVVLPGLPIAPLSEMPPRLPDTLVMTGTYNYHPNIASAAYFVRRILPLIHQVRPAVRLQLVGAHPVRAIRAMKSPHVDVTGFVPSIASFLQAATCAVAPVLYAAGMQNKVLEAFLNETPLVATSAAVAGLDVKDGEHLLVADQPAEFAQAVLRLLGDPALRAQIARAGRRYVEENHDIQKTTQRLIEIYQEVKG